MKIYTKILIGMLVGAVIGLTLGPRSVFLEADLYKIPRAGGVTLLADPDDPSTELPLPPQASLRLSKLELRTATRVDAQGESHELPALARVSFRFSQQMALFDEKGGIASADGETLRTKERGDLRRLLGQPRTGDRVEAWLVLEATELQAGGFVTTPEPISALGDQIISYLSPIGELFMKLIMMVIVPLVFASLLVGVASLGDIRKLGRLGSKTLLLYLFTTATAITIGLLCAHAIGPGNFVAERERATLVAQFEGDADARVEQAAEAPSMLDNLLDIVPSNPMASLTGGDMLQIIFFAVIFGIALTLLKEERSRQVVSFFDTIQQAMIMIIHMVMAVAPFGVAALIAEVVGSSGFSVLKALVVYGLTVLIGLAILAGGLYGGLVRFYAKIGWVRFMKSARPAQLIGFSTSSSSATLPVTLQCAQDNLGISRPVSSFVIPLGSTVNMDGTALYQGVAAIFIAQVFQVELSFGAQVSMVLAATMASIGAAGVPGAGMITLAMVLTAAGIPAVGVALILGMDRLLDMFRTAVNVTGDLAVTTVMAASEGEKLEPLTSDADAQNPDRGFEGRLKELKQPHPVKPEE
jgi:proton glutamate symport protein